MIIQCRKCETKYRFDKSQMEGEGVWVRCTRCEATFFQKNPLAEVSSFVHEMGPEREDRGAVTGEIPKERDGALEETEAGDVGQEPTWGDAYRDTGEGIEIERVEQEEDRITGEAEAGDAEREPTGEDVYRDTGEGIEFEGVEEEEDRITEEAEAGDVEQVPTGEDAYRDAGEGIGIEEEGKGKPEEEGPDERGSVLGEDETEVAAQRPQWEETYGDVGEITGGEETRGRQRVREPWSFGDADEGIYNDRITGKKRIGRFWSIGMKVALYLILVVLLSGGVYLWLVPESREMISNRVSPWVEKFLGREKPGEIKGVKETVLPKVEKMLGIKDKGSADKEVPELRVNLINVGERFVKGWTAENIMVVEGSAVNASTIPISNIRVRGKILDSSGKVLFVEESDCGTILTDDELKSLTRDEIKKELSNPYGRDLRNADIKPGAGIPFMLVFTMPAEEASELVVELIGIEAAKSK